MSGLLSRRLAVENFQCLVIRKGQYERTVGEWHPGPYVFGGLSHEFQIVWRQPHVDLKGSL